MYPLRVFVSYSHEDRKLTEKVVKVLQDLGLTPVWDSDIRPGVPFTDAIKSLIAHAHIFMPLVTKHSQKRPWIHQETGFAMALNVPVLPLAVGKLPGEMLAQLQAISVKPGLENLEERLKEADIERLVVPSPTTLHAGVVVAELPETRTDLMAQYAKWLAEQGTFGKLRQRGALSSFCLPDADINDPVWKRRDGTGSRSDHYHFLQREERRALEAHARKCGCSLIIDPTIDFSSRGPGCTRTRLSILLQFLESMTDDKVQVVMSPRAREGSLTLVGDWFVADSMVPRPEGYRQTVFSWHAPTVLRWVNRFDRELEELQAESSLGANASRQAAMDRIKTIIRGLPC